MTFQKVLSAFLAGLILGMVLNCTCAKAASDDELVAIIVIEPVERQVLVVPERKIAPLQSYDWSDEDIDALASVYWAETGANGPRTALEKLYITQLVWNRSQHGSPFPTTIAEVCKQRGEFNRGRISDRNRRTARENLNKVRSQAEGFYQGIDPNAELAIYMTREGGSGILTFQDESWVTIYRVEG